MCIRDRFGFASDVRSKSVFASSQLEMMNGKGPGTLGHIGIATNNVERAIAHLKMRGVEFDEDSRTYKNGKCNFIYLKNEISGFAFHLVTK